MSVNSASRIDQRIAFAAGEVARVEAVSHALLDQVRDLRVEKFFPEKPTDPEKYGLKPPLLKLTVTGQDGKIVPLKETADTAIDGVDTLESVIVFRRTGEETPFTPGRDHWWHEIVPRQPTERATERTSAEDPLHDYLHLRHDG